MKRNTIKWRIFKYNLAVIAIMIILVALIFNVAVKLYMEKDILNQLDKIATRTENTVLNKGPEFSSYFHEDPPPLPRGKPEFNPNDDNDIFRFYFMLDRSLKDPLSVLNADYILFDSNKKRIPLPNEEYFKTSSATITKIITEFNNLKTLKNKTYLKFNISGTEYIAIIKQVSQKDIGFSWIIIYSSLEKINQLQIGLNAILFIILIVSAMVIVLISSLAAKKISAPFSSLSEHIRTIAERNFGTKIDMPVYDELQEFVNNINIMSEKLETYDKAQKTFFQNASHEFRTPLMSIQSYAEGIKYDVVDTNIAANIIIDETKRMTRLVEDLMYLSRLNAIEESYNFYNLNYNELINSCVERMNGIAVKNNIKLISNNLDKKIELLGDEEKISRAITNIISNCIRYATSTVSINSEIIDNIKIKLTISDDGPGIDANELPNIFERFYKGKKGVFGLGLAISKNAIEKHDGKVYAKNSDTGALFIIQLPIKFQP